MATDVGERDGVLGEAGVADAGSKHSRGGKRLHLPLVSEESGNECEEDDARIMKALRNEHVCKVAALGKNVPFSSVATRAAE